MKLPSVKWAIAAVVVATAPLALGCGTQSVGASTTGDVPKMAPGANLPRWQHVCVGVTSASEATTWINEAGEQGWEMVAIAQGVLCFKRPKFAPASVPPPPAPSGSGP